MPKTTKTSTKKVPAKKTVTKRKPVAAIDHPIEKKPNKTIKRTYLFAVGRRKEAVARVRWYQDNEADIKVNKRTLADYFPLPEQQQLIISPLKLTKQENKGQFTIIVNGGGTQGQAVAIRLGIARILVKNDQDLRIPLKRAGYLRRDPRVKERKKYGLKRARRAPQWQKR